MWTMKHLKKHTTLLLFLVCLVGLSQAAQLFYSSDLGGTRTVRGTDAYEVGAKFVTGSTPPTITALGFIDLANTNPTMVPNGDGLIEAHRVTLWLDSDNSKVTEVIVPAGQEGQLIDGFRYAAIPEGQLTLLANTAYVVSADTTGIQDSWLDDYDQTQADVLDTADPYFVGSNGSTTWQPRWGTGGSCPDSSWHSSVFYGLVNITSELLYGAYDPLVIQTAGAVQVDAVFTWKAAEDPDGVNAVDPRIARQDVYVSLDQVTSTDPNLFYIGSDTTVSLTDPNSKYPATGFYPLDYDASYDWAVVTILNTGNLTLPAVGDPMVNIDPNHAVGQIWTVDTLASTPVITDPLDDIVDAPGQSVQFTIGVSSISQEHYKWFKSADNANNTPGDDTEIVNDASTLSLNLPTTPATYADYEGYYYCLVYNDATVTGGQGGSAPDVLSNVAKLGIAREVAYWTMDQADYAGNQYVDVSTEDAVADNIDPNYPAGVSFGQGAYSLGATSAIAVNNSTFGSGAASLAPAQFTDQITISAWVYLTGDLTGADGYGILTKGNGIVGDYADNIRWALYARTRSNLPSIRLTSWAGGDVWADANSLPVNEWAHVAASVDADGVGSVYINGVRSGYQDTNFVFGGADTLDDPVRIGRYGAGGLNFPGQIDDIRLYNYGMDNHAIAELYNAVSGKNACIDEYPSAYDIDNNCKVDIGDLAVFSNFWLDSGLYPDAP